VGLDFNPPTSAFKVAGIIGVNHHTCLTFSFILVKRTDSYLFCVSFLTDFSIKLILALSKELGNVPSFLFFSEEFM
jgi:hypothetical protein